ncbi:hypothetical protein AX16_003724 [Volvariella volvacea WC 439]|nr:hypothetical protein AX16_003724 [Volvariella volvacea WC 439]
MALVLQHTCPVFPPKALLAASSQSHAAQAQSILADKEADLARLELEVQRARSILDHLIQDRDEIRKYVDRQRALLAPIQRVPLEILQEIFVHCLPTDLFIRPDSYKAPLLLARVCRAWRHVVLSTPKLWSRLAIQLSQANSERRISMMKTWILRSSGHPVCLFAYVPTADDTTIDAFLRLFTSNLHRWKNLRLTLPAHCRLPVMEALNQGTPLLESLQIRFSPINPAQHPAPLERLALSSQTAPRLQSFNWISQGSQRIMFDFRMTHLTDVDIDYPLSVSECLDIVEHCPKLIRCEFRAVTEWATIPATAVDTAPASPFVLPALHSLSIHTTQALGSFFDRLTLPALHTLKVIDMNHEPEFGVWSQSRFNDFIERSNCQISHLHLLNVLPNEDALIQCLQWTSSSLVELRLLDLKGVTVIMDRTLRHLTVRQTPDADVICVCPKLEMIKLGTSLASTDGLLADMVESRWKWARSLECRAQNRQIAILRSINPRLDPASHPEDIRRLAELRNNGLELL